MSQVGQKRTRADPFGHKEDKERAWELFRRYDDKVLSFTDCTSLAVMDRLELDTAFTLDHDFEALGYIIVPF